MPRKLKKIQCPFCEEQKVSQGLGPHVKGKHPIEFALAKEIFPNTKISELLYHHIDVIKNRALHAYGFEDLKEPIEVAPEPLLQAHVLSKVDFAIMTLEPEVEQLSLDELIELFTNIVRRRIRNIADNFTNAINFK